MFGNQDMERLREATSRKKPRDAATRVLFGLAGLVLFCVGCALVYSLTLRPIFQTLASRSWMPMTCLIVSSEVERVWDDERIYYRPRIVYEYKFGGKSYLGDRFSFGPTTSNESPGIQTLSKLHSPGSEHLCYVNPQIPSQCVLIRGITRETWDGLMSLWLVAFGVLVMLVGFGLIGRNDPSSTSNRRNQ